MFRQALIKANRQTARPLLRATTSASSTRRAKVNFLETLFGKETPLGLTTQGALSNVGNTPLVHVANDIYVKLEGYNLSGSVKDRTINCMVLSMIKEGTLKSGDTLVLATSSSAGIALMKLRSVLLAESDFNLKVCCVVPQKYRKNEAVGTISKMGAQPADQWPVEADAQIVFTDGDFKACIVQAKQIAADNEWGYLNQHYDTNNPRAHHTTAMEILEQLPQVTDVVAAVGTGGTAAGLRAKLPPHVTVHSRPAISGTIPGVTDIRLYDNFCDPQKLAGYTQCTFDPELASKEQKELNNAVGLECGMSSGAAHWLAKQIKAENPHAVVAFVSACHEDFEHSDKAHSAFM